MLERYSLHALYWCSQQHGAATAWHFGGVLDSVISNLIIILPLATLAAFDVQAACKCLPKMALSCYTFGAPRVGNHAFAHEYNEKVPETWNVSIRDLFKSPP